MENLNKWILENGKVVKSNKGSAKTASDLIADMREKSFDNMEQPIVDSLSAKDKQVTDARQYQMADSVDRKRIAAAFAYQEQKEEEFIDFLMKANQQSDQTIASLEQEGEPIVEVKQLSFADKLAQRLGGQLAVGKSKDKPALKGGSGLLDEL